MTELIVMYFKAFVLTPQSYCWHSSKLRQKEGRQYKSSDVIQPKDRKERKGETFFISFIFSFIFWGPQKTGNGMTDNLAFIQLHVAAMKLESF
jgi:hypothetical protein